MNRVIFFFVFLFFAVTIVFPQSWIRINQLGYKEKSIKVAVLVSKENLKINSFEIKDAETNNIVFSRGTIKPYGKYGAFNNSYRLNFSAFNKKGNYYILANDIKSPIFRIDNSVYDGTADFLLKYMRQQRCGYNPFLKDSCHTHDGFIVDYPAKENQHIDVTGGWHDASDYLQYVTTSANSVFEMLFAFQQNPSAFDDKFDKNGDLSANGIPDILDEAKWGLDWLVKMNPGKEEMYNQIADDRDHRGFRSPVEDTVNYGKGLERPVYFCTGKPQGLMQYKNRTNGIASTAAKYSSAFSLGSKLLAKYYPDFAKLIAKKSIEAFDWGSKNPGVNQTASCVSPYFYEEDNWLDDMQLAAIQLKLNLKDNKYLSEAVKYGMQEPFTPWMGADTARHYQWYPFLNLGHYFLAVEKNKEISSSFKNYLKSGLQKIYSRGENNPFLFGIPFIWCSNNLVSAAVTQAHLYQKVTNDKSFEEMEAALRDWLFGCNPWGTSMIIGLPENKGISPQDPHSALYVHYKYKIDGGLVDGPVYGTIFNSLKGIKLANEDEFAEFQSNVAVYHDDYGDYSTNEPTMDGTASLTYYLSALQSEKKIEKKNFVYESGAIIRGDTTKKQLTLVFTGHEFADGSEKIISVLKKYNIKAGFFFTGDFYRNPNFKNIIINLKNDGHYLGSHSDKHLLYADWTKRDSTLITKDHFSVDLYNSYTEMRKFGIKKQNAPYFLPPYEWYNNEISDWSNELGLTIINYSPGTSSNGDYTIPEDTPYYTSTFIFNKILRYERESSNGLNGFMLITHFGTDPKRKDKFYDKLENLIIELQNRGYKFVSLPVLLK